MTGHVFAVASGKGGVGKTTTAINLGIALRMHDRSVAIVDGDLGMPNLSTMVGVEHEPTLHEVLAGEAEVEAALVEIAEGFYLVPGNPHLEGFAAADPDELRAVIDALVDRFEFVVLDTGAGLSYESVLPLEVADEVLFVTSPDPSSVADTRKTLDVARRLETAVRGVVISRAGPEAAEDVVATLDLEVLGVVPDDEAVTQSGRQGRPLQAHAPESPAARAYRELGATLLDEAVADPVALADADASTADVDTGEETAGDEGADGTSEGSTAPSQSTGAEEEEEEADSNGRESDDEGTESSDDAEAADEGGDGPDDPDGSDRSSFLGSISRMFK